MQKKALIAILKSEGVAQTGITVIGNTLATGMSAIALLAVSRSLGPELFGQFSVGFAIIIMLNKFNDFGLNAGLLKYGATAQTAHDRQALFDFAGTLKLYISGVILVLGIFLTPWLIQVLHFKSPVIIYSAFFLSIFSTWYEHLLAQLQSLHRFTQAVIANALQSGSKLLFVVPLAIGAAGQVLPMYVVYMISPAMALLFSSYLLGHAAQLIPSGAQLAQSSKKLLLGMAKHSALGFIAAGIIENIDVLFVQGYLSEFETGLLSGVSRIAMMVMLIAYSLGNVLYPRVARYQTREHLEPYLRKAWMLSAATAVGFLLFLPLTRWAILLTVGPAYAAGESILTVLMAASFLTIATVPFLALFYSFHADWYFSVSGVIQLLIVIVGNGVFVPRYGLEAAAWTRLLSRTFLFLFTVVAALLLYHKKYAQAPDAH